MKHVIKLMMAAALAFAGAQAHAIALSPGDEIDSGSQTSTAVIDAHVESTYGVTELYKMDVDGLVESGAFSGSYNTVFNTTPTDPADATITYTGGDTISCPDCYVLVKDGNQDPAWYLFDISGWNGIESIFMTNFWPTQGAISHVSIYGDPGQVPEPGPLALLAVGLVGIGLRRLKKAS